MCLKMTQKKNTTKRPGPNEREREGDGGEVKVTPVICLGVEKRVLGGGRRGQDQVREL